MQIGGIMKRGERLRWTLTALLLLGALFPAPIVRDPVSGGAAEGARLVLSPGYLAGAPLFGVWDRLTVLPLSQHIALLLTLFLLYGVWRTVRTRGPRSPMARIGIEVASAALSLALLLGFYGAGVLLHRPMASLALSDPDLLALDLHAHTDASHDVRTGFGPEKAREWRASSGFHAALITDHYNWGGWAEGALGNPARAGDGVVLIQGAELKLHGKHTNVIGDSLRYKPFIDDTGRNIRPAEMIAAIEAGEILPPTFLMPLPVDLDDFEGQSFSRPLGLVGIEINDSSPKGLEQALRDRARILAIADSLDLAIVAGSNHHGWGRTAAAWSLMRLPGWRTLTPPELEERIEGVLRTERREAVRVVERSVPYHRGNVVHLAATGPLLVLDLFRTLSYPERASWLLWVWGGTWLRTRARRWSHQIDVGE